MSGQERQFLGMAVRLGFLSQEEAQKCLYLFHKQTQTGSPRPVWEVALRYRLLTEHQIQRIQHQLQMHSRSAEFFPGYRIVRKIGQGGMGTVYEAIQTSLDRRVALKVISPEHVRDATYLQRITREAKVLAKLNHPNIVSAIDFGCHNGVYYLVMEYVEGESLDDALKKGRLFSEKEVLAIGLQMAKALNHAYQQGLIHRDIKPANIMIDRSGTAKLCDLGLAKEAGSEKQQFEATQATKAVGTPIYMSPEQVRGEKDLDIRTDIYSLGATLYHLATGQRPYKSKGIGGIFNEILSDFVPNPRHDNPHLSLAFSKLIRKMMAKRREDRPQTPSELIREFKQVQKLANISTASRIRLSDSSTGQKEGEQKFVVYLSLLLSSTTLILLVLGGLAWFFLKSSQGENKKKSSASGGAVASSQGSGSSSGTSNPSVKANLNFEELCHELFGSAIQELSPPEVKLSYSFDKDSNLDLVWHRSMGSWQKNGSELLLREALDFVVPMEKLTRIAIGPKQFFDFTLILKTERKSLVVYWYTVAKTLEVRLEGKGILRKTALAILPSEDFPLVVEQRNRRFLFRIGTLQLELPEEYSTWRDFTLVANSSMGKIGQIQIYGTLRKADLQQAVLWIYQKPNLLGQMDVSDAFQEFSLSSQTLQPQKPLSVPQTEKALAYIFTCHIVPPRKVLNIAFPFRDRLLKLTLRRSPSTKHFPCVSLWPLYSFFLAAPVGPKPTLHEIQLHVTPWIVKVYTNKQLAYLIKAWQVEKLERSSQKHLQLFSPTSCSVPELNILWIQKGDQ